VERVERVEETYVRQQADQSSRVSVALEPQIQRIVNVSPHAFSRFDGQVGNETVDEYRQAAIAGALSAPTEADTGGEVTILEVDFEPAPSTPDTVRVSTLIATSLAIRKLAGRY
jgi:dihydropteroate synthase